MSRSYYHSAPEVCPVDKTIEHRPHSLRCRTEAAWSRCCSWGLDHSCPGVSPGARGSGHEAWACNSGHRREALAKSCAVPTVEMDAWACLNWKTPKSHCFTIWPIHLTYIIKNIAGTRQPRKSYTVVVWKKHWRKSLLIFNYNILLTISNPLVNDHSYGKWPNMAHLKINYLP